MVKFLILVVKTYQKISRTIIFLWSPVISPIAPQCRFHPTCSDYFVCVLDKHGFFRGFFKGLYRVLKCNPFSRGGIDYP